MEEAKRSLSHDMTGSKCNTLVSEDPPGRNGHRAVMESRGLTLAQKVSS